MKLFWKILGGYFLAWALLTAALFAILFVDLRTELIPRSPISTSLPAAVGVQLAGSHLQVGGAQAFRQLAAVWSRGEPPFVVNTRDEELLGRTVPTATLELARSLARDSVEPTPVRRITDSQGQGYVVFYPDGRGPEDRLPLRYFVRWPWLLGVVFAVAGLLLAGGLSAAWTRPIAALERSVDRFTEGDLRLELSPEVRDRRDEIGDLARHVEQMAGKLAGSVTAQRRLLHDISHELRSPLARLAVAVELARRQPGEMETTLARIEKECGRLDRLIHQALTLARLENATTQDGGDQGASPEAEEYFDLLELLRTVHEDLQFEAQAVGVRVELRVPEGDELVLRGRAELLHRAVENVVRNALQHAVEARQIELRLERVEGAEGQRRLQLHIADDGRAQPDTDLDDLFTAFRHGETSGGFGLGLAIARRAVALHGGTIRAEARTEGGVEFVIELPDRDVAASA